MRRIQVLVDPRPFIPAPEDWGWLIGYLPGGRLRVVLRNYALVTYKLGDIKEFHDPSLPPFDYFDDEEETMTEGRCS